MKRFLAMLLAFLMIVSIMPTAAFAAGADDKEENAPLANGKPCVVTTSSDNGRGVTVAFTSGGGMTAVGETITVSTTQIDGYTFVGWFEKADSYVGTPLSADISYTFTVTGDMDLVAVYKLSGQGHALLRVSGTKFQISEEGSTPQYGYYEQYVDIGKTVTLKYLGEDAFHYWKNGEDKIMWYGEEYTFTFMRETTLAAQSGGSADTSSALVVFATDLDQVLSATTISGNTAPDAIEFPPVVFRNERTFIGWNRTAEQIIEQINNGVKFIVVMPEFASDGKFTVQICYNGAVVGTEEKDSGTAVGYIAMDEYNGTPFSYWTLNGEIQSYATNVSFWIDQDSILNAVYEGAQTGRAITKPYPAVYKAEAVHINSMHAVTSDYKVTDAGFVRINANKLGGDSEEARTTADSILNILPDNPRRSDLKFNQETHGHLSNNGEFFLDLTTMSGPFTVYLKTFVSYQAVDEYGNPSGEVQTQYSDMMVVTYPQNPEPVADDYVAKIGETGYKTFTAAAEAAGEGDVIELLADITVPYVLTVEKSVSVKLNSKTLVVAAPEGYTVVAAKNGDVTTYSLKEGTATNNDFEEYIALLKDIAPLRKTDSRADVTSALTGMSKLRGVEASGDKLMLTTGREYMIEDPNAATSDYANWNIDFEVSFSDDVKAGDVTILGKEGEGAWGQLCPVPAMPVGRTLRLAANYGRVGNASANTVTYAAACAIADYLGGAVYTGKNELTMTVKLYAYETELRNGVYTETGAKHVIDAKQFKFAPMSFEEYVDELIDNGDLTITQAPVDLPTNVVTALGDNVIGISEGKLDSAITYTVIDSEAAHTAYANWNADIVLKFDNDVEANDLTVLVKLGEGEWTSIPVEETITAGDSVRVITGLSKSALSLTKLCTETNNIVVGAVYTGEKELKMTAQLVGYETQPFGTGYIENDTEHPVDTEKEHLFTTFLNHINDVADYEVEKAPDTVFPETLMALVPAGIDLEDVNGIVVDENGNVTLDSAIDYTIEDETAEESEYANWNMDFLVSFDKDVAAETVVLLGYYKAYGWVPVILDATQADTPVRLLQAVVQQISTTVGTDINPRLTYAELCDTIKEFICGAVYLGDGELEMTVQLVGYETNASGNEISDPIMINEQKYFFKDFESHIGEGGDVDTDIKDQVPDFGDLAQIESSGLIITEPMDEDPLGLSNLGIKPENVEEGNWKGISVVEIDGEEEIVLENARSYKIDDTTETAVNYDNWHVDYVVSFDKPVKAGNIILLGNYGSYTIDGKVTGGWLPFMNPRDIVADNRTRLIQTYTTEMIHYDTQYVTYKDLRTNVKEFLCGAAYCGEDELTMYVDLVVYETEKDPETGKYVENGVEHIVDQHKYVFGKFEDHLKELIEEGKAKFTDLDDLAAAGDASVIITGSMDEDPLGMTSLSITPEDVVEDNWRGISVVEVEDEEGKITTEIVLESGRKYSITEDETDDTSTAIAYKNWHADYELRLSKDIGANQLILMGNYASFLGMDNQSAGWIPFINKNPIEANDQEDDEPIRLIEDYAYDTMGVAIPYITYEFLYDTVKEFLCGAAYCGPGALTLKVDLYLYETVLMNGEYVETGVKHLVDHKEYTFNAPAVAQVDGTKYETFADAVTAAGGEKTIELLDDIGDYTLEVGKALIVKAGEYSIHVKAPNADYAVVETAVEDGVTKYEAKSFYQDAQGIWHIVGLPGLQEFAGKVNNGTTYAGKTVVLENNIDLENVAWTPIGNVTAYPSDSFAGTFDGNGKTISNMTTSDNLANHATAGLFGSITNDATVKNVKLENVAVTSTHYAAALVGYIGQAGGTIEDCSVKGGTITSAPELLDGKYDNGDKVGGILGYGVGDGVIKGCSVEGVTIKAYRDIGGIAGCFGGTIENCSVKNSTIKQDDTNGYKAAKSINTYAEILGRDTGATLTNNTYENVTLTPAFVAQIGTTKYTSLNAALAAAAANDEIVLTDDFTLDYQLNINKAVTLNLNGKTVTLADENAEANVLVSAKATIKNGSFVRDAANTSGPMIQNSAEMTLSALTVDGKNVEVSNANGFRTGYNYDSNNGYGILVSAKATISDCVIENVKANATYQGAKTTDTVYATGAGITAFATDLTLTNTEISNCQSNGEGAALCFYTQGGGSLVIDGNSKLNNNVSGSSGGAAYVYKINSISVASTAEMSGNVSNGGGGAMYLNECNNAVIGGIYKNNKTEGTKGDNGGAFYIMTNSASAAPEVTITGALFEGNTSAMGGGAIFSNSPSSKTNVGVNIVNTTFTNNVALGTPASSTLKDGGGAAVYASRGYIKLDNCIMTGNHSNGYTDHTDNAIIASNGGKGTGSLEGDKNGVIFITNCTGKIEGSMAVGEVASTADSKYKVTGTNYCGKIVIDGEQVLPEIPATLTGYTVDDANKLTAVYSDNSTVPVTDDELAALEDKVLVQSGDVLVVSDKTFAQLVSATNGGELNVYLAGGEYTLAASASAAVKVNVTGICDSTGKKAATVMGYSLGSDGKTTYYGVTNVDLVLNNVTVKGSSDSNQGWYHGIQSAKLTCNYCDFVGGHTTYADTAVFNNCHFDSTAIITKSDYAMYCYNTYTDFNNCTFVSAGKAIKIYSEGNKNGVYNIANCTFTIGETLGATKSDKAAIQIDSTYQSTNYTVNITSSTQTGYDGGLVADSSTHSTVTVDGVQLLPAAPALTFTRALPDNVNTIGNDDDTQLSASDLFQTENEPDDIDVSKVEIKVEEDTPASAPKRMMAKSLSAGLTSGGETPASWADLKLDLSSKTPGKYKITLLYDGKPVSDPIVINVVNAKNVKEVGDIPEEGDYVLLADITVPENTENFIVSATVYGNNYELNVTNADEVKLDNAILDNVYITGANTVSVSGVCVIPEGTLPEKTKRELEPGTVIKEGPADETPYEAPALNWEALKNVTGVSYDAAEKTVSFKEGAAFAASSLIPTDYPENEKTFVTGTVDVTEPGEYTVTYTITDGNYTTKYVVTVIVEEIPPVFDTKFVNHASYLYRVGNANDVALNSLFAVEGKVKDSSKVSAVVTNTAGTAAGTFTPNASDWTKATIMFSGTGVVSVTLKYGEEEMFTLPLEVINATNATTATSATTGNVVLLNDVGLGSNMIYIENGNTIFGNGFKINCSGKGTRLSRDGLQEGFVNIKNGTLVSTQVVCKIFAQSYLYTSEVVKDANLDVEASDADRKRYMYQWSAVSVSGDSTISDCYIYGARSNVLITSGNVRIDNSVLECGSLANIYSEGGSTSTITLNDLTTIQHIVKSDFADKMMYGVGILAGGPEVNDNAKFVLEGELKQYNWACSSDSERISNGNANLIISTAVGNANYINYKEADGEAYANLALIYLNSGNHDITDNRTNKAAVPYKGAEVSLLGVNGYVYSVEAGKGTVEQIGEDYSYSPETNGEYHTQYKLNPDIPVVPQETTPFYYNDNGTIRVEFTKGTTYMLDALSLIVTEHLGEDLTISVSCEGAAVDGSMVTFTKAGNYDLVYTVSNENTYGAAGSATGTTTSSYVVLLAVKTPKGEIKDAEVSVTAHNSQGILADSSYKYRFFDILDGLTIIDYDDLGNQVLVLDPTASNAADLEKNFIAKICKVTSDPAQPNRNDPVTYTLSLVDGRELMLRLSSFSMSPAPGKSYDTYLYNNNNKLYYMQNKDTGSSFKTNKEQYSSCTISSYKYTGFSGKQIVIADSHVVSCGNYGGTWTDLVAATKPTTQFTGSKFVIFNVNGGEELEVSYTNATSFTIPTTTREGYKLVSWDTKQDGTGSRYNVGASVKLSTFSTTTTLYAQWLIECDVIFDADGGLVTPEKAHFDGTPVTLPLEYKDGITQPPVVYKEGYWLIGWFTAPEGGTKLQGSTFAPEQGTYGAGENVTIYAHWSPIYTVTYDLNAMEGDNPTCADTTQSYTGTDLNVPVPTPDTKAFMGWFTDPVGGEKFEPANGKFAPTANVTYYAHWQTAPVVTYNANGGTTAVESASFFGEALTMPTVTKEGFWCTGWWTEPEGGEKLAENEGTYSPTGDITLYAQWSTAYTVTFIPGDGATVSNSTLTYMGKPLTLPTPTKTGYDCTGWYTAAEGGTKIADAGASYTVEGDMTMYAQWKLKTFTVTIKSSNTSYGTVDKGSVSDVPYGSTYSTSEQTLTITKLDGTTVTVTAKTTGSGKWNSWSSASGKITEAITITAKFDSNCLVEGTMITMADGSKKAVENIVAGDELLVWNLFEGCYDTAPVVFNDSDSTAEFSVINAVFSDGTTVKVVSEHVFFDLDLGKYVYFDENAAQYIGHSFVKYADGENAWSVVTLDDVYLTTETVAVYSPVTAVHLCYYANDMLSIPGGIPGLFNIFAVDVETMTYNKEAMEADIANYGLLTLADFPETVSETMFNVFNGQFLGIAIGKGILTWADIASYAGRYAPLVSESEDKGIKPQAFDCKAFLASLIKAESVTPEAPVTEEAPVEEVVSTEEILAPETNE